MRHRAERGGLQLDLFVFEQAANQFGSRILGFIAVRCLLGRQQHARLDLDQHRGHQQVFGGEFEIGLANLVDVAEVLPRQPGHRDVEDVEVLLADQVEQQVQRAFERFQEDLERLGRDVQVVRQGEQRFAIQAGERNLIDHVRHRRHHGDAVVRDDFVLNGTHGVVRFGSITLPAGAGARNGPDGHLLDLGLVDVGLHRNLGFAVFLEQAAVEVLVP